MSLAERLAAKTRRSTTFDVALTDPGEAQRVFRLAERALSAAILRDDGTPERAEQRSRAQTAYDDASRAVLEHYERLTLVALPAADFEALLAAHPRLDGDEPDASWHEATFLPALLAECAQGGLSADEWVRLMADWSQGERLALREALLTVNLARPETGLPKG